MNHLWLRKLLAQTEAPKGGRWELRWFSIALTRHVMTPWGYNPRKQLHSVCLGFPLMMYLVYQIKTNKTKQKTKTIFTLFETNLQEQS